jgi:hypothetical protein
LCAAAIRKNAAQAIIFGSTTTWGKGLGQTYFVNYAQSDVLGFSTSYYLAAAGEQIDQSSIWPDQEGRLQANDLVPAASAWVFARLRTVPVPILPQR